MQNLVKKFNEYNTFTGKLTPFSYKSRAAANTGRAPRKNTFKVIDLDGSAEQRQLVIEKLSAITDHNSVQILDRQPSNTELHVVIANHNHAKKLNEIWALPIGSGTVRIAPTGYTAAKIRQRNAWVGRTNKASLYTNARLLNSLEPIGVKDVYRNKEDTVFLVFDSEDNYYRATTRALYIADTPLKVEQHTTFSPYGRAHRQKLPDQTVEEHTVTGANNTPLNNNRLNNYTSTYENYIANGNFPQRS
jgi:hypothetical protein